MYIYFTIHFRYNLNHMNQNGKYSNFLNIFLNKKEALQLQYLFFVISQAFQPYL